MIKEVLEFASGYRLKSLKSINGLDGIAWSATLYKDGKRLGGVFDDGYGGSVMVRIGANDLTALKAVAREKVKGDYEPEGTFLSALADYSEAIARLKRQNAKNPIVIAADDCDEYGIPTAISKFKCSNNPANLAELKRRHPDKRFFADEVALW